MSTPLPDPRPRDALSGASLPGASLPGASLPGASLPGPMGPESGASAGAGVRSATAVDADAIGAVQAAVWHHAYAADLPAQALAQCTPEAFATAWSQSLAARPSPRHVLLVAHEGTEVVGLLALAPSEDPDLSPSRGIADATETAGYAAPTGAPSQAAEILVLGVHPHHRRAGHGSRLLAAAGDLAGEMRFDLLTTWVLARHEETRTFLQGAGFAPDRARRERVVDADGGTALEARLSATVGWLGVESSTSAEPG